MIRTTMIGRFLTVLAADRLLLTILVTLGLWGSYELYARTTRPLLKSRIVERQSVVPEESDATATSATMELAQSSLPKETWLETANYKINHEQALIYFDKRTLLNDDKTLKVSPFALVVRPDPDDEDQTPTTLVCESALLNFESRFDLTDIKAEGLQGGSMRGRVHVTGPKRLAIRGNDFQFSRSLRIWSDRRVAFRFERHVGEAIGVEIRLKGDPAREQQGLLAAKDIRSVSLRRDVLLHVYLKGEENDLLRVESKGRFDFDFETSLAEFHRKVVAIRPTGDQTQDTVSCDVLRVQFNEKAERQPDGTIRNRLEPVKMSADGRIVRMTSDKEKLTATASHLAYDVDSRTATLIGAVGTVNVYRGRQTMVGKKVELKMDDDNEMEYVKVKGPGFLRELKPDTDTVHLAANFEKHLEFAFDPKTNLRVVTLTGKAAVEQPADGVNLNGNVIRLWLEQPPKLKNDKARADGSEQSESMQPTKIVAIDSVRIQSPQLNGRAKKTLTVEFADVAKTDSEQSGVPAIPVSSSSDDSLSNEDDGILDLDADEITVRVVRSEQKSSKPKATDVWLSGRVLVKHQKDGQAETEFSGTDLHVRNEGKNKQFVTLRGDKKKRIPARIKSDGRIFEGLHLEYDRLAEQGEAVGEGHIYLPIDRDLEGNKLSKTQPLDLKWDTSMQFNGLSATFFGNATARLKTTEQQSQSIQCEKIVVTFDRQFRMTNPNSETGDQAKVKTVDFVNNVKLKSGESGEDGELQSYQVGSFRSLRLDQTSGDLYGQGPGWIKSWRPGRKGRANLSPVAVARANTPLQSTSGDLEFAWIDFVGRMQGNLKRRLTTFYGGVRVIYGPVTKMAQQINPDDINLERMPRNSGMMRCGRLEVHQPPKNRKYLILKGNNNVELEGHDFRAQADVISYDQSKAQFNLQSLGRANATIWRQTEVGAQASSHSGRRFIFIPSRGILKSDDAQNLNGLDPSVFSRPASGVRR